VAQTTRDERLEADFSAIEALRSASTILDFEPTGDAADRYTVVFRGKGLARDTSPTSDVEIVELHKVDIRLPYAYPERGPDIRWLTPIFHPNVSFSGFINLKQIGLPWDYGITLDVIVERLWDVARLAYFNPEKAVNYSAKNWFESESTLRLPLDHRPLRDKAAPSSSNIIRYERRGDSKVDLQKASQADKVFYIGEDTAPPEPPPRRIPPRRRVPPAGSHPDDDDILYIG